MKQKLISLLMLSGLIFAMASSEPVLGCQVKKPDIAGVWDIKPGDHCLLEGNSVEFFLKDGRWEGKFFAGTGNTFPLAAVTLEENRLMFSFEAVAGGGLEGSWIYSAKLEENRMEGTCRYWIIDEDVPFTAKKRKA